MELRPKHTPPLLIASDAQASTASVSAAFLVIDTTTSARWGIVWKFDKADLGALGYPDFPTTPDDERNPISAAEAAAVAATYVMIHDRCG